MTPEARALHDHLDALATRQKRLEARLSALAEVQDIGIPQLVVSRIEAEQELADVIADMSATRQALNGARYD